MKKLALLLLIFIPLSLLAQVDLDAVAVYSTKMGGDDYTYRIPSLITTKKGSLIAFAERRVGLHDHAQNDIVMRSSKNNGKTWGEIQVIADFGKKSLNDPLAVVLENGRILLIFQEFPYGIHARNSAWIQIADTGYDGPRNTKTYLTHSDDEGKTWSTPKEITKEVRPHDRISIGSPGIGIQLKNGEYKGRIVLPLYLTKKENDQDRYWTNAVVWSDDNGETWTLSNDIPHKNLAGHGNEAQVVEKADGSLLFISRNQGGYHRKVSNSKDGGRTWTNMKLDFELPGIHCQGSVLRYSFPKDGESIILYSAPSSKTGRYNGTVWLSNDEGETWKYAREITPDYFSYSCLVGLSNGEVGLLYESKKCHELTFVHFPIEWIKSVDRKK